jgi:hypothetical protein
MDNLDRMYRHLVRTVRARFPQYLTQTFDVSTLYQTILPYRLYRRELGLETNEDYQITLTELLSGARDYLIVDDQMRDALRAQLASVNPDPEAFKEFASAAVALSPNALRTLESGPADDSQPPRVSTPQVQSPAPRATAEVGAPAPSAESASRPSMEVSARPSAGVPRQSTPGATAALRPGTSAQIPGMGTVTPAPGERCRSCNEVLPTGRPITFCPHCGQNVTTMNCPACGSELELGWKFCPVCGRPAGAR